MRSVCGRKQLRQRMPNPCILVSGQETPLLLCPPSCLIRDVSSRGLLWFPCSPSSDFTGTRSSSSNSSTFWHPGICVLLLFWSLISLVGFGSPTSTPVSVFIWTCPATAITRVWVLRCGTLWYSFPCNLAPGLNPYPLTSSQEAQIHFPYATLPIFLTQNYILLCPLPPNWDPD